MRGHHETRGHDDPPCTDDPCTDDPYTEESLGVRGRSDGSLGLGGGRGKTLLGLECVSTPPYKI